MLPILFRGCVISNLFCLTAAPCHEGSDQSSYVHVTYLFWVRHSVVNSKLLSDFSFNYFFQVICSSLGTQFCLDIQAVLSLEQHFFLFSFRLFFLSRFSQHFYRLAYAPFFSCSAAHFWFVPFHFEDLYQGAASKAVFCGLVVLRCTILLKPCDGCVFRL